MSKRKFYKTIIEVTVLSEEPLQPMSLGELSYETMEGDMSATLDTKEEIALTDRKERFLELVKIAETDPKNYPLLLGQVKYFMSYIEEHGKEAAEALKKQGSAPEFFQIDEEGNDLND